MKVASVTEMGADFAGYLKASEQGPVVVTRNGKPVAVLLRTAGADDLDRLLMGHSPTCNQSWRRRKRFARRRNPPRNLLEGSRGGECRPNQEKKPLAKKRPNQRLKLTGAALVVSRTSMSLRAPRQLGLNVRRREPFRC